MDDCKLESQGALWALRGVVGESDRGSTPALSVCSVPQQNFMLCSFASLLPEALPKFWKNQEITKAETGTVLSKTKFVS